MNNKYKDQRIGHVKWWPSNKSNLNQNNRLVRPGSFSRGGEKITRPHLVIVKMKTLLLESLDFFASFFGQAKNEEPSRLEAKCRSEKQSPFWLKPINKKHLHKTPAEAGGNSSLKNHINHFNHKNHSSDILKHKGNKGSSKGHKMIVYDGSRVYS